MRFLIITHVFHKHKDQQWLAYAPYVREMNLWLKYVDEVEIVAHKSLEKPTPIDIVYKHKSIHFNKIPDIQFTGFIKAIVSLFKLPIILWKLFGACRRADHIHLRCPGNIGLLGAFVQVFFPGKIKTAKYAGNWDPKAKQPLSYRFQKRILSNTFWTKNMTALVYGAWDKQTKNIKSFFTATFNKSEIEIPLKRDYSGKLSFVFVGSLVIGKRPLLTIQIVESLHKAGKNIELDMYGDGILKAELQDYIIKNNLGEVVYLHGNQNKETVKKALKHSHFLILPSKSEGWPKAVAEAMFFGCIPVVTKISCVPFMLDYGKRGILIEPNVNNAVEKIKGKTAEELSQFSKLAYKWSQDYTLDTFETEIAKLIVK